MGRHHNNAHRKEIGKTRLFDRIFKLGKYKCDRQKFPHLHGKNLNQFLAHHLGNEIIVNSEGHTKIDNLDSCKDLCRSDFTVYSDRHFLDQSQS